MKSITVYTVVFENTLLLDAVGPTCVFDYANRYSKQYAFQLRTIGPSDEVRCSGGITLKVDALPHTIEADAWIIVPGLAGIDVDLTTPAITTAIKWLQQQQPKRLIGICGGALVLAKAGLLASHHCTTHHAHLDELRTYAPNATVLDDRLFVEDGTRYTSAGVTAGIDLSLHMVQTLCGPLCAAEVARSMVLFTRRGPNDPAYSPWLDHRNHVHQGIHRVQDAIQQAPAKQWPLEALAAIANCSPRHLARLFKQHTQTSTRVYIHKLRITLASQLLQTSSLTIEQIAEKVGFQDTRQFHRIWKRSHECSPAVWREHAQ